MQQPHLASSDRIFYLDLHLHQDLTDLHIFASRCSNRSWQSIVRLCYTRDGLAASSVRYIQTTASCMKRWSSWLLLHFAVSSRWSADENVGPFRAATLLLQGRILPILSLDRLRGTWQGESCRRGLASLYSCRLKDSRSVSHTIYSISRDCGSSFRLRRAGSSEF